MKNTQENIGLVDMDKLKEKQRYAVYGRKGSPVKFDAEKGISNEVFSHRVIDTTYGWGNLICLAPNRERAHQVVDALNFVDKALGLAKEAM